MIQARDHSDLDKRVAEKVMSSQDSGLILMVEQTKVSSGLDADVRKKEKLVLTTRMALNNWKDAVFIN